MRISAIVTGALCAALLASCGRGEPAAAQAAPEPQAEPQAEAQEAVDLSAAPAGTYTTDPGHRYITFTYDHAGYSYPFVRWREWTAKLEWDPENPENSSVHVEIDANSIDTGVDRFDAHMRTGDLFDVENHPVITFKSTKLERTGANTGLMTGDLTILGNTRPVTLDVTINKAAHEQRGDKHKLGFSARASLKRSDFGVSYAVPFVGDEVNIIIEAEFEKPA